MSEGTPDRQTAEGGIKEQLPGLAGDVRAPAHPRGDRDLDVRRIQGFAAAVVVIIILASILCWTLYLAFRRDLAREDPPPPPLLAARAPVVPPDPRLQESPELDMAALRERELGILRSYGWVDRKAGIARIPIDRAIDLTVSPGLQPARTEPADATDGGAP